LDAEIPYDGRAVSKHGICFLDRKCPALYIKAVIINAVEVDITVSVKTEGIISPS
jgi:hypothetical protein